MFLMKPSENLTEGKIYVLVGSVEVAIIPFEVDGSSITLLGNINIV